MTTTPRSTPRPWPDGHCNLLREQYATGDLKALAAQLGRSITQLMSKADRLGLKRDPETRRKAQSTSPDAPRIRDALIETASLPTGTRVHLVANTLNIRHSRVDAVAQNLCRSGLLFKARISHRNTRYFTDPKIAAAINKLAASPAKAPGSTVQGKLTTTPAAVARWTRGPAYLPGEPVITASTRFTIAPPPPARTLRTNTHMQSG